MKLVYLTLTSIVLSCSKSEYKINYPDEPKVDNILFNHFPDKICNYRHDIYINANFYRNNEAIFLKYEECDKKDSLISIYEKKSIAKYNSKNNCLFIINSTETIESLNDNIKVMDTIKYSGKECFIKNIPVPNFKIYFDDFKDYTIYVLEAKNGNYSENYKFTHNVIMPEYWNNGYSKGIAINNKNNEVIFWGNMW